MQTPTTNSHNTQLTSAIPRGTTNALFSPPTAVADEKEHEKECTMDHCLASFTERDTFLPR